MMIVNNFVKKVNSNFLLNFPIFAQNKFNEFISYFKIKDIELTNIITEYITCINNLLRIIMPMRFDDYIEQLILYYANNIIDFVVEELINREILSIPENNDPMVNGLFSIMKIVNK